MSSSSYHFQPFEIKSSSFDSPFIIFSVGVKRQILDRVLTKGLKGLKSIFQFLRPKKGLRMVLKNVHCILSRKS